MTTEEKAKAYDEALNWMREIYPGLHGATKEDAEHFFPELTESEDERVIRALETFLNQQEIADKITFEARVGWLTWLEKQKKCLTDNNKTSAGEDEKIRKWIFDLVNNMSFENLTASESAKNEEWKKKVLAYLEKQKEASKAIKAVERIDKYIDENVTNAHDMKNSHPDKKYCQGVDATLSDISGILHDVYSEKQKEQKPKDITLSREDCLHQLFENGTITMADYLYLTTNRRKQKPAEKQDYSSLNDLERAIHRGFLSIGVENVPVTVIKETAKECLAQIKLPEWSKEDRGIAQNIMEFLKDPFTAQLCPQLCKECQDWLKSLPLSLKKRNEDVAKLCSNEWSEEDKQDFDDLIMRFEKSLKINRCYFTSYDVDWLKSKFNGNSCK